MLAVKSVTQNYSPPKDILELLDIFRRMVNQALGIGLAHGASSLKRLSLLSYRELKGYDCPSRYKICAISRAAGILAARRKSLRRGFVAKSPYAVKPQLTSCYDFKIEKGMLSIPVGKGRRWSMLLNKHVLGVLSEPGVKMRSFTLTPFTVSLCVSKEVEEVKCYGTGGVDRNLRSLTYGNEDRVVQYDLSKAVVIADTTRSILASFRRNDVRIRRRIASKYGRRRRNRTVHLLHHATRQLVNEAFRKREAIVLEDIRRIRGLYGKGNWQGRNYRARMNGWSYGEAQRQIEYKARWLGVSLVHLSRGETMGTSSTCPRCGERLQSDKNHRRELWCRECEVWKDRDVVAAVNLSQRGRLRFDRSRGGAVEALKGNPTPTVIPGVDAPKLAHLTIG